MCWYIQPSVSVVTLYTHTTALEAQHTMRCLLLFALTLSTCTLLVQGQDGGQAQPDVGTPPFHSYPSLTELPLELVQLPPGFNISLYTNQSLPPARGLAIGPATDNAAVVFVSSNDAATITALIDTGPTGTADTHCALYTGPAGELTNGLAYDPASDTLYATEKSNIIRLTGAGAAALAGCDTGKVQRSVVYELPAPAQQQRHGSRALVLLQNGTLVFTVGIPANDGSCVAPLCTLYRVNTDGSEAGVFAQGLRNAAALTVQPTTGDVWLADMGKDYLWRVENLFEVAPDERLYRIPANASLPPNFQFPYCHWQGSGDPALRDPGPGHIVVDDAFPPPGAQPPADKSLEAWNATFGGYCAANAPPPVQALGPHVAPLGLAFYTLPLAPKMASSSRDAAAGQPWPAEWAGDGALFVGEHGSWNRVDAVGYRIAFVRVSSDGRALEHRVFASGWLQGEVQGEQWYWGRPVGVAVMADGSMLVSDDNSSEGGGAVYRITYQP